MKDRIWLITVRPNKFTIEFSYLDAQFYALTLQQVEVIFQPSWRRRAYQAICGGITCLDENIALELPHDVERRAEAFIRVLPLRVVVIGMHKRHAE